jgi:DNA-binding NarL/FixJ family response regulator
MVTSSGVPTSRPALSVLIGDDQPQERAKVRAALEKDGRFCVCGEATSAAEVVSLASRRVPEIAILEVMLPGGGIAAAWEISQRLPTLSIVMYTTSDLEEDLLEALHAGADGYLLKSTDPRRLAHALWDVHRGYAAMPRALMARVISQFHDRSPSWRPTVTIRGKLRLSAREWQILQMLESGATTSAIASDLSITPATVRSHRRRIAAKLRLEAPWVS